MNNKLMQEWIKLARKYELKRIKVADLKLSSLKKAQKGGGGQEISHA